MFPNILWAYELHKSNVNSAYKFKFDAVGTLRVSMVESLRVFTRKNSLDNKIGRYLDAPRGPGLDMRKCTRIFSPLKTFSGSRFARKTFATLVIL